MTIKFVCILLMIEYFTEVKPRDLDWFTVLYWLKKANFLTNKGKLRKDCIEKEHPDNNLSTTSIIFFFLFSWTLAL
jgi:hypothetical protein